MNTNELFFTQPVFEKTAGAMLDQDSTKWKTQVLNEFFTEFPQFMSRNVEITFKQKDDKTGNAVGSIFSEGLVVPVIVDSYELSPFDVMYFDGVTLPLTEETLGSVLSSKSAFKDVVVRDADNGRFDRLFQGPLIDIQPTVSKVASLNQSMIDRVSDSITSEHKQELLESLQDEEIRAGFEKNGTVDVLEKIASVKPKDKYSFKDALSRVIDRDIHYIHKTGRFQYKGVFGNSQVDDVIELDLDEEEVEKIASMKSVKGVYEKPTLMEKQAQISKGAALEVPDEDEKLVVLNVDGIRKHAFIHEDEKEVNTSSAEKCAELFPGEIPKIGDYGVFVKDNEATEPFEVTGLIKSAQNYRVSGFDGSKRVTYEPVRGIDQIEINDDNNSHHYITTDHRFVKLGEQEELDYSRKQNRVNTDHYFVRDDTGAYRLHGPEFSKYAELGHQIENIDEHQVKWAALHCNASEQEVKKMNNAPVNVKVPFHTKIAAPVSIEKVASTFEEEYQGQSQKIRQIAVNLVKEASTLTDKNSVDAMLSLNLVTKDNVMEFVQQLPLFEQVLSSLSRLLLTVRLGLKTVPERAVVRSMKGLSKVVAILRGISKLDKIKKNV